MAILPRGVVTEIDRGWGALKETLSVIKAADGGAVVNVGILGPAADQPHGEDGITNAELATVHEFGSPAAGIPERSFLRSTFNAHREDYRQSTRALLRRVIERRLSVPQALGILGEKVVADVRATIRAGIPPPNAPATVARKGSSTPLIDSGQLVGAIAAQVVIGGKRID